MPRHGGKSTDAPRVECDKTLRLYRYLNSGHKINLFFTAHQLARGVWLAIDFLLWVHAKLVTVTEWRTVAFALAARGLEKHEVNRNHQVGLSPVGVITGRMKLHSSPAYEQDILFTDLQAQASDSFSLYSSTMFAGKACTSCALNQGRCR